MYFLQPIHTKCNKASGKTCYWRNSVLWLNNIKQNLSSLWSASFLFSILYSKISKKWGFHISCPILISLFSRKHKANTVKAGLTSRQKCTIENYTSVATFGGVIEKEIRTSQNSLSFTYTSILFFPEGYGLKSVSVYTVYGSSEHRVLLLSAINYLTPDVYAWTLEAYSIFLKFF